MTDVDRAKAMLPDMPEEVFDLWIRHCVDKSGWPYDSIHDEGDQYWQGYFLDHSLATISNLRWQHERLPFSQTFVPEETRVLIGKMIFFHSYGINPGIHIPHDSKGRFDSAISYIKEHAEIPSSIVLLSSPNGFKIFDGWHRLAAIYALQESLPPLELSCWIAS